MFTLGRNISVLTARTLSKLRLRERPNNITSVIDGKLFQLSELNKKPEMVVTNSRNAKTIAAEEELVMQRKLDTLINTASAQVKRRRNAKTNAVEKVLKTQRKQKTSRSIADKLPRIIAISSRNAIKQAVHLLKKGEVIAIPTDTVYGFACSANNTDAIHKIYEIKDRCEQKPLAICVASIEELRLWGETKHLPSELLSELLPGAVTLVVKRSSKLNKELNREQSNIGIRITENYFIQEVCKQFKEPIALTSANKSSSKSTLNINEFEDLWPELGAVFDGGQLSSLDEQRAGSTVIDFSEPDVYNIIRAGVSEEKIINIVAKYNIVRSARVTA